MVTLRGRLGTKSRSQPSSGIVEVDGRRHDLIAQRQHSDGRFQSAGAAKQMSGHRLGRADQHLVGMIAEGALHGGGFQFVAQRRRGAVRIDVADLLAAAIPASRRALRITR